VKSVPHQEDNVNDSTDKQRSIADRVDSFPEPWKPKAGDKLVGEISELDERTSEYGTYPIVVVLTSDGSERAFHAFHTVAKNELARQRPRVGDTIAVKYFGKDAEAGYERYRVLVEHATPMEGTEPSWDTMQQEATAELASDTGTDDDPGAWPEGAQAVS
jgi:hypothetical protein